MLHIKFVKIGLPVLEKIFEGFLLGMSTNVEIGIQIFAKDIRIYSNIRMRYTSMLNRPITMTYLVVHVLKI